MAKEAKTPKEKNLILSIKSKVQTEAKTCFSRKLSQLSTLEKFMSFNEQKGLDKLQVECTNQASMVAIPKIMTSVLKDTFADADMTNSKHEKLVLSNFDKCSQSRKNANDNPGFADCIKKTITDASKVIAYESINALAIPKNVTTNAMRTQYQDIAKHASTMTKECFEKGLKDIKDIESFIEYNEQKKFDAITNKCTEDTTKYGLRNILPLMLEKQFTELNKQNSPEFRELIRSFNSCKNGADLVGCTKQAITKSSELISAATLDQLTIDKKDEITDANFVKSLKPKLSSIVSSCFKNGLEDVNSLTQFMDFNAKGGIEKMTADCTYKATEFALPEILKNETSIQLDSLSGSNLGSGRDQVLKLAAKKMREDYKISIPANSKDPFADTVKKLYSIHYARTPSDKATDDLLTYYKEVVEKTAVGNIHNALADDVKKLAKGKYNFDDFFKVMGAKCVNEFYEVNKKHLENLEADPSKPKMDLGKILSESLFESLAYSKSIGTYESVKNKFKDLCRNPKKFSDINVLLSIKEFESIYKPVISQSLITGLNAAAYTQCFDEITSLSTSMKPADIKKVCSPGHTYSSAIKSAQGKTSSYSKKVQIEFILERKNHFVKTNQTHLKVNSKTISDIVKQVQTNSGLKTKVIKFLNGDKSQQAGLTKDAIGLLFGDRTKGGFTDKFMESQVAFAIGTKYDTAFAQAKKKVDTSKFGYLKPFRKRVYSSLNTVWKPKNLKSYLNWNNVPAKKKKDIIDTIITNTITPMATKGANMTPAQEASFKKAQAKRDLTVETKVKDLLENVKTYRGKTKGRRKVSIHKTFMEKVNDDITEEFIPF